jgi:hypothetical protein
MKVDAVSDAFNGELIGYYKGCTVLAAQAEISFENGTIADLSRGVYSHHIYMTMTGKTPVGLPLSTTCKNKTGFFANMQMPKLAQSGPTSAEGSLKSINGFLEPYLLKGKTIWNYITGPFIVN